MRAVIVLAAFLAGIASQSPYTGETQREIKALSAEQIAGYLSGDGMALALPAELNDYPGPSMCSSMGSHTARRPR